EFRELLYRWHPWFGLQVGVHEAIDKKDGVVFRCSLSGTDAVRCLEIPAWMFDRSACARMCATAEGAHSDLTALTALAALLHHALSDRFASSKAPVSVAPSLPHDQNRGDIHATSHEAEAGAQARTAADRSVRGRPAERARHAGVVRPADGDTDGTDQLDDAV